MMATAPLLRAVSGPTRIAKSGVAGLLAAAMLFSACQVEEKGTAEPAVTTLDSGYDRLESRVLARRVKVPTEANLDFAAYSKNVMLADPEPKSVSPRRKIKLDDLLFGSLVVETKAILDFTPLSEAERSRPMHWSPVLERLLSWNFERTAGLANAYSAVTSEKWGDTSDVGASFQEFASVWLRSDGNVKEVWVEIEFKPWMAPHLDGIGDRDQDRYPEAIARLNPALFTPEMAEFLAGDYSGKVLSEGQVMDWARNLASRWYPSYNTDLADIVPGLPWPPPGASGASSAGMGGAKVGNPLFAYRGRPFEDTLWNVFEVDGMGAARPNAARRQAGVAVERGLDAGLTGRLDAIAKKADKDLKELGGGSWETWEKKLAPFRAAARDFADREPLEVQGLPGKDGWLVLRREIDYLLAPDRHDPEVRQQPLPVIAALKDSLAALGIDFLFIPIPTKLDVYPEILSDRDPGLPGGIAQPHLLKLRRDLAEARVETVDLLTPFLRIKAASDSGKRALYQKQDTHWSTVGLEAAAQVLAERVKQYSWYDGAFRDKRDYRAKDTLFETLGDIQARLSDRQKARFGPETQLGRRVSDKDSLYRDEEASPVLVIGDSYCGVFHTVGCRNAGVTAHLARSLGGPVDLIMGWGGGPEAPRKLSKRGAAYLAEKRLVVWMMSARDLFVYPGEWSAP